MTAEFAKKLRDLVDVAMQVGQQALREALRDLADVISKAFDSELVEVSLDGRLADEAISDARTAAEVVDACHVIKSRLFFTRNGGCFREFKLPRNRDYHSLSDFLDLDVRAVVEGSPFVYIVWRRSPESYFYVGKSDNKDGKASRLKLEGRGKLLDALQQGSIMTLMLPRPQTPTVASDVEAAVLAVLYDRERLPSLNVKQEKVPRTEGSAHLSQIGRLLDDLAAEFKVPPDDAAGGRETRTSRL